MLKLMLLLVCVTACAIYMSVGFSPDFSRDLDSPEIEFETVNIYLFPGRSKGCTSIDYSNSPSCPSSAALCDLRVQKR